MPLLDAGHEGAAAAGHPGREGRRRARSGMLVHNNQHRHAARRSRCARRASATGASHHLEDLAAFTGGAGHHRGGRADASTHVKPRVARPRAARDRHRGLDARSSRAPGHARGGRGAAVARSAAELARATHDRDVEVLAGAPRAAVALARRDPRRRRRPTSCSTSACAAPRARSRRPRRRWPRASSPAAAPRCCARAPALDALELEGDYATRRRRRAHACSSEPLYWIAVERRLRRPGDDRPGRGDARAATASTRSPASSATCSRRASSTRSA